MALEKLSVQNARELVNYLITEVIRHVRCAVELQMRLVPHAVAQVKLVYTSLRRSTLLDAIPFFIVVMVFEYLVIRPLPQLHKENNFVAESMLLISLLEFTFPHSVVSYLLQLQLISSIVLKRVKTVTTLVQRVFVLMAVVSYLLQLQLISSIVLKRVKTVTTLVQRVFVLMDPIL
jgi:hypothetical protein